MITLTRPETLRILAFDPAAGDMGIAVADYHRPSGKLMVIHTEVVVGAKLLKDYKWMRPVFTQAFCIQTAYHHYVSTSLLPIWKPDEVVSESAFYHRFAATLISLTLVINSIRQATRDVLRKDIHLVAPTETKLMVTGKGGAKKDVVRSSILSHPNIVFTFPNSDLLSEHEYDAIGHGYAFCKKILVELLNDRKK